MKFIKPFFLLFVISFSFAQQQYGLEIVKELTSPMYDGRGYVNNGHNRAAKFIADKFSEYGLKPIEDDYYQYFNIDVNTFPAEVQLTLNNQLLKVGEDYIIDANSGSSIGDYTPFYIHNKDDLFRLEYSDKSEREHYIAVIEAPKTKDIDTVALYREMKYFCANLVPVLWITDAKFTWTVGRTEFENPIFEVKREFAKDISGKVKINVKNAFKKDLRTQNVIGKIEGKHKNKTIVVSAHYDHLGRMGTDAYFPGANDNASGVAMLLYLAKYYSENTPPCNIVFMSFGAEEVGIVGSKYYVNHPLFPLKDIRFLINLDILGTGEEGITVVNEKEYKKQFKKLSKLNVKKGYLEKVKVRGKAANSDHYFFSESGVPSIFIYTLGGISFYHDVFDKGETLPLNEFDDLEKLLADFIKKL